MKKHDWPELNFQQIQPTLETLHQWLQIVGKIRLRTMPWQNHSWHVALYVGPSGFSTQGIPFQGRNFQIDFDFQDHSLRILCSGKTEREMPLEAMTVAQFYEKLFSALRDLGFDIEIHGSPNEMEPAIPFATNTVNKDYDSSAAEAIWKAMSRANEVFYRFRSDYLGKVSPVHLFWGAFDLAVTRFSGRAAPLHQGGMPNMPLEVMQEAYSQEVSSAGFWPGSKDFPYPAFYAYAYPTAEGFADQPVEPAEDFYSPEMGEFFLKYEDLIGKEDPDQALMAFLQSTYAAAANTANWDRDRLER